MESIGKDNRNHQSEVSEMVDALGYQAISDIIRRIDSVSSELGTKMRLLVLNARQGFVIGKSFENVCRAMFLHFTIEEARSIGMNPVLMPDSEGWLCAMENINGDREKFHGDTASDAVVRAFVYMLETTR